MKITNRKDKKKLAHNPLAVFTSDALLDELSRRGSNSVQPLGVGLEAIITASRRREPGPASTNKTARQVLQGAIEKKLKVEPATLAALDASSSGQ
jgi:hypothetical protein